VGKFDCKFLDKQYTSIPDQDTSIFTAALNPREEVTVSRVVPVLDAPCPLCQINNAGGSSQYGSQSYFQIHHTVSADAQRFRGTSTDVLAERVVGSFVSLQPWPE